MCVRGCCSCVCFCASPPSALFAPLSTLTLLPLTLSTRYEAYSQRLAAALTQQPGAPVPLEELSVILYAVQEGLTDGVAPSGVGALLQQGLDWLRQHNPQVRREEGCVVCVVSRTSQVLIQVVAQGREASCADPG